MILNKETTQAASVVFGIEGNEHDWQSTDGVYVNRTYRLIYTSDLVPNKVAVKTISGWAVQDCLNRLYSSCAGNWNYIQRYRREFLGPVVEVWGNAEMYNKRHKHTEIAIVRLVKKAAMSRKHKEKVDLILGMYVAAHFNELKESDLTIHVQDKHTELIVSEKDFLERGAEHMRGVMRYDQFCSTNKAMGYFSLHFPTAEEVQKLLSSH